MTVYQPTDVASGQPLMLFRDSHLTSACQIEIWTSRYWRPEEKATGVMVLPETLEACERIVTALFSANWWRTRFIPRATNMIEPVESAWLTSHGFDGTRRIVDVKIVASHRGGKWRQYVFAPLAAPGESSR